VIIDNRFDSQDHWGDLLSSSRALVPVERPALPMIARNPSDVVAVSIPPPLIDQSPDEPTFRHFTPRQMVDVSMDLYVAGMLGWDEYSLLAFQPELHPDYDRTVGALTGRKAEPDRPRDIIAEWEDRLMFEKRYNPRDGGLVESTRRIVAVLKQIENPIDVLA
jgi:hypothetical protein